MMLKPSVTQCIPTDFSGIDPDVLEAAAQRGTDVHNAAAAYARGLYVPGFKLDSDRRGYFRSFSNWFDKYVKKVLFVEKEFHSKAFGFVGHIDLVCDLIDNRRIVIDLKTPATLSQTWRLQLSAYHHVVCEYYVNEGVPADCINIECMSLRLMKDGREAKAVVYNRELNDFTVFLSALNVYRFINS